MLVEYDQHFILKHNKLYYLTSRGYQHAELTEEKLIERASE